MSKAERKHKVEKKYKNPIPTVDVILRKSSDNDEEQELLIETRGRPPFERMYSIPGGHVEYGETVEHAALRELYEESGAKGRLIAILGVYSDPRRDPRGQRITTVFIGDYAGGKIKANDDARSAEWIELSNLLNMKKKIAFDHYKILGDYRKWCRSSVFGNTFWSTKRTGN